MREKRLLLVDLGKVLVDLDFNYFRIRMQDRTGLDAEQLRDAIMGGGLASRFERGELSDRAFHAEICGRTGADIPWDEFVDAWNCIFLPAPILPDSLLAELQKNADIWAISNTNKIHFEFIAARYSFMRYLRGYTVSYEVGCAKPARPIFEHALQANGAQPADAIFIDDQLANVEAAREMGISSILFQSRDQFLVEARKHQLL